VRLKVKKAGSVDLLAKLQEAARNTNELMMRMGSYVRAVSVEKIDSGDGLAPWAESTKKKYENTGTGKITASGRVRASVAKKLDQTFRRKGNDEARQELRAVLGGSSITPKNKTVASLQRKLERAKQQLAKGGSVNIGKRKARSTSYSAALGGHSASRHRRRRPLSPTTSRFRVSSLKAAPSATVRDSRLGATSKSRLT
jgi:hypothetical protein